MKTLKEQYGATDGTDGTAAAGAPPQATPAKKCTPKKNAGGEKTPGSGKRGRKKVKEEVGNDEQDVKVEDGDDEQDVKVVEDGDDDGDVGTGGVEGASKKARVGNADDNDQ